MGEWLQGKWLEKEKLLKEFYTVNNYKFKSDAKHIPLKDEGSVLFQQISCTLIWYEEEY
jgi:hypothetical protein